MTTQDIPLSLRPVDPTTASTAQREILQKVIGQVGFLPNLYANMANAPGLLNTYLHGSDLFRKESGLTPAEQEVVMLAVSQVNDCRYCMAAHSLQAARKSGVPADVLTAIRARKPIADARLRALFEMTCTIARTRGQPDRAAIRSFLDVGFEERHLLYLVLAVAVKAMSNYTNHLLATPLDPAFAAYRVD